jgi:alpha-glucosidase
LKKEPSATKTPEWWQTAVFYQIYPRSFADSNGDGIGDLPGITARLDYLRDLGVDAIWLSPHFPSPLLDCGYDVSDYLGVAPEYGALADFQRLLAEVHGRGMRLILDLVLNHTSDQHAWFQESRSSRDNSKRDWYIWRDGRDGGPPNNWYSTFGGSAWELDEATGQYFYHYFFKQQPDLNWRDPRVKEAMFQVVRFWLDMGVDGFRLDAIGTLFEHPDMPDHTATLTQDELLLATREASTPEQVRALNVNWQAMFGLQVDQPGMHELLKDLRKVVDRYPGRVLVGESDEIAYHGSGDDELHLVFNFPLMRTNRLTPAWVLANQQERLEALPAAAWPCNTLGNHDSQRVFSHFADGCHDREWARISLALALTLKGTPFLYYGEEIGMTDLLLQDVGDFRDMLGVWLYETERRLLNTPVSEATLLAASHGRDKCRTPMQWSAGANAGFCPAGVRPWLPVNLDCDAGVNVTHQKADPTSLLSFYRRLLAVRRATPALQSGGYTPIESGSPDCLAFLRTSAVGAGSCLVAINMSPCLHAPQLRLPPVACLFSSSDRAIEAVANPPDLCLAPFEVFIGRI